MINSMARSLITAKKYYRNMLAGNEAFSPGSFELISTTILGSSTASVTFDVTGLGSTYKHLQIRTTVKSDGGGDTNGVAVNARFNSDTASNYSWHGLDTNQAEGVRNPSETTSSSMRVFIGDNATYGAGVLDILDAFATSKYKTTRGFGGNASSNASYKYLGLYSGSWRNTSAVTSINFISSSGSNFVSGSRFSLYGIKG